MAPLRRRGIIGVVTDRRRLAPTGSRQAQERALVEQARAAALADVDIFQVRERDLPVGRLFDLTCQILEATAGAAMKVLVNDRLDVALSARAHGVHLPGAGLSAADVRRVSPEGFLVGVSIHADEGVGSGVDYAIYGTVFPSASKAPGQSAAGIEPLGAAARRVGVPVLAIGGIGAANVTEIAAVCDGVAAIGWFSTTDARRLSEAVRRARVAFDTIARVI